MVSNFEEESARGIGKERRIENHAIASDGSSRSANDVTIEYAVSEHIQDHQEAARKRFVEMLIEAVAASASRDLTVAEIESLKEANWKYFFGLEMYNRLDEMQRMEGKERDKLYQTARARAEVLTKIVGKEGEAERVLEDVMKSL